MNTLPPSIDDIIQRVKAEAQKQVDGRTEDTAALLLDSAYQAAAEPHGAVHLGELLLEDGDAFLQLAYRTLFGREPDPWGLEHFGQELARHGKLMVLASLYYSPEGQARKAKIFGAALPFRLYFASCKLARYWIKLDIGRLLRAYERFYEDKLIATRALLNRTTGRIVETQTWLADSEARLSLLLDMHESLLKAHRGVAAQQREIAALRVALHDQQRHVDRLLQELAQAGQAQPQQMAGWAQGHLADKLDLYYRAFEDANRGSLEEIRAKLAVYLPRFAHLRLRGSTLPILDIGCGRGEWLALLKEQGHAARGVDMNPVMVAASAEQGLAAEQADAYAYLRSLPDASLAAVTGFHIVEHLPFETLYGIFEEAYRVLAPGGVILFETPNPENVLVGSHTFYHDFSHRNPVTPAGISFLARYHHFDPIEIERHNPYPATSKVPGEDALTERVNGHLYGCQDYALIAQKPELAARKEA